MAPLDAWFLHGCFHVGTDGSSARIGHLRERPAVSLTHFDRDELAIIVHGQAIVMGRGHPDVDEIQAFVAEHYGSDPFTWGEETFFVRVEAETMYTFARYPDRFFGLAVGQL